MHRRTVVAVTDGGGGFTVFRRAWYSAVNSSMYCEALPVRYIRLLQWVGEPDVLRIGVSIFSQVYIVYFVSCPLENGSGNLSKDK